MSESRHVLNSLLRVSFYHFLWRVFLHLHPSPEAKFHRGQHTAALCHALEQVMSGRVPHLIVNMPPRNLKSITVSVALPAFVIGHKPDAKFLVSSYGDKLAENLARNFTSVVEADFYREAFPQTVIQSSQKYDLITTAGGRRTAVSVGGAVTGLGADYLIIDDVSKAGDINSPTERQKVKDFYNEVLYTRLNDKSSGRVIAIM